MTAINGAAGDIGSQVTLPSGALVTLLADGSYDYDPNGQYGSLAAGETATDSFTYTVDDGNGGTDMATVNITIEGANAAPIAQDNVATAAEDGAAVSGNVIADDDAVAGEDSDPNGDDLSVTAVDGNAVTPMAPAVVVGTYGTLTQESDGSYSYAPDNTNPAVQALADGETLTETFTYELSDENGGTDTADLVITIDGANDPVTPVVPGDPNPPTDPLNYIPAQTGVDSAAVKPLDLTPYFMDADSSDTVTLSIDPADLPAGLTFDGTTISGTPDADASQGGLNGVYIIPVTATDSNGSTITTNVTYTITNPVPIAQDDALSAAEDTPITGSVITDDNGNGVDSDPDGDDLTVTAVGGVADNVGTPSAGTGGGLFTIDANGDYTFDANGEFEGLDVGETATSTITYEISDGEGGTDTATVTVTINGENDAPVVTATLTAQTGIDSVVQAPFDASTAFSDVDGEALAFTSPDIPAWMEINPATGVITGTPPADASQGGPNSDGVYTVTVTATDPDGAEVSTQVTYTFTNPVPVVDTPAQDITAVDSETLSIPVSITDPDGDTLTFSTLSTLPAGLTLDPATGEISGTLDDSASQGGVNGVYEITILADDGEGGTVSELSLIHI